MTFHTRYGNTNSLPLLTAIDNFSNCRCLDPSDKVYGLLGMVHPGERIEVQYTAPPRTVMYRALRKVLEVESGNQPIQSLIGAIFHDLASQMGLRTTERRRIDLFINSFPRRDDRQTSRDLQRFSKSVHRAKRKLNQ